MNHDGPARRSYSEKELRALIQRATELHEAAKGESDRSLSLDEIEHIAAELGLPPEYLRTAALELENQPRSDKTFSLWGGPFVINQARVVDETMTQEQWAQAVMDIRALTGKQGHVDEIGAAREWTHAIGEGDQGINFVKTRIALRPEDGHTTIQIRKQYGGVAISAYVAAFILSAALTIATIEAFEGMGLPDPANWTILVGVVLGSLAAVRGSLSVWANRQKEKLKQLTNRLHQTLSTPQSQTLIATPTTEQIDIPEPEEPEQIFTEARQRTRA